MNILVVGSGGREHCLVWKLKQSALVDLIYCAPGNAGTALHATNVAVAADNIEGLLEFARTNKIDLTVVGPEVPLVAGIVDRFNENGFKIFGPTKALARLEGSKIFAKEIMKKYGVPTADSKVFTTAPEAKEYVKTKGVPIVIKADGLAAGKGVVVALKLEEAYQGIDLMLTQKKFGEASKKIVIEDCLQGEEASLLIVTDSDTVIPLVSSQDHKQVFDADKGPNTGGMGAYAPAPLVSEALHAKIMQTICNPLIAGLKSDGLIFKGILYVGLMIQDGKPLVLEFNVRFGDPETQAILPKLNTDLARIMLATVDGTLSGITMEWDKRSCLCVVLASGGYPGSYKKGAVITGLENCNDADDVFVFHAGTKQVPAETKKKLQLVTNGGRVLGVVALADTLQEAQSKVYGAVSRIHFDNMHYRKDIGSKALHFSRS